MNHHPHTTTPPTGSPVVDLGAQATKHAAETTAAPRPITHPNGTRRPPRSLGAAKRCPICRTALDGGPVRFRCEPCGRAVAAADLDTEYHPPVTAGRAAA